MKKFYFYVAFVMILTLALSVIIATAGTARGEQDTPETETTASETEDGGQTTEDTESDQDKILEDLGCIANPGWHETWYVITELARKKLDLQVSVEYEKYDIELKSGLDNGMRWLSSALSPDEYIAYEKVEKEKEEERRKLTEDDPVFSDTASVEMGEGGLIYSPDLGIKIPLNYYSFDAENMAKYSKFWQGYEQVIQLVIDHVNQDDFANIKNSNEGTTIVYLLKPSVNDKVTVEKYICAETAYGYYKNKYTKDRREWYYTNGGETIADHGEYDLVLLTCHGDGIYLAYYNLDEEFEID